MPTQGTVPINKEALRKSQSNSEQDKQENNMEIVDTPLPQRTPQKKQMGRKETKEDGMDIDDEDDIDNIHERENLEEGIHTDSNEL